MKNICSLLVLLLISLPAIGKKYARIKVADSLEVVQISKHTYVHVSHQTMAEYGKFTSNGLIYINGNEAVVMDTPPHNLTAAQLLGWISKTFPAVKIKAVIITHFHDDCLGGLDEFHKAGIPSYAYKLTQELAAAKKVAIPQHTFDSSLVLQVGSNQLYSYYPGEAHTRDNIVSWIAEDKVLFGGCMIKSIGSGKGNIADANVKAWSGTVSGVKAHFRHIKTVIPGHGVWGGKNLLNYTISMFTE